MTQPAPPKTMTLRAATLMTVLAAIWGSTFFYAEIILTEMPPLTLTLSRVVLALPILGVVLIAKRLPLPRRPRIWGAYLIMGALNNAVPFSLIFWGQTHIDSSLASILNANTAMFGAVVAGLVLRDEPLTPNRLLGAALGVVGVACIMGPGAVTNLDPASLGQIAVVAATVSYAFAGVWGRVALSGHPPLVNAFGMLVGSTALMLPVVLTAEGVPSLDLSPAVWAALIALASLATALAYGLYFPILALAGAANLLLVTLLIPVFGISLGVLFLGDIMLPRAWIGFAIIALGFAVTDGRVFSFLRAAIAPRSGPPAETPPTDPGRSDQPHPEAPQRARE